MQKYREMSKVHKKARQDRLLCALHGTNGGQISLACAKAGISRQTHYNWCKSDTAYRERYERIVTDIHARLEESAVGRIQSAAIRGYGPACRFVRNHFGQDALENLLKEAEEA